MSNLKKEQKRLGIKAQSTSSELADIDKRRCYSKRESPDLSKMKSKKIDFRTYVFAKNMKLLKNTIKALENR